MPKKSKQTSNELKSDIEDNLEEDNNQNYIIKQNKGKDDSFEYSYELKIPKERIAVLIGKNGTIKKDVEKATNSKINIDSREGDITIIGGDSLGIFSAREVVKAIGRGFNPEIAMFLLKPDYTFDLISLPDYIGKSKKRSIRLKGRVIGEEGKTRKIIEDMTDTRVIIYGKTIGIIGFPTNVANARRAIEALLSGSPHSSVYRWLEKKRRETKMEEFEFFKKNNSNK